MHSPELEVFPKRRICHTPPVVRLYAAPHFRFFACVVFYLIENLRMIDAIVNCKSFLICNKDSVFFEEGQSFPNREDFTSHSFEKWETVEWSTALNIINFDESSKGRMGSRSYEHHAASERLHPASKRTQSKRFMVRLTGQLWHLYIRIYLAHQKPVIKCKTSCFINKYNH